MFKWHRVKLLFILVFVLASSVLMSRTPGWKTALADASKYGYGTSMWFYQYAWTNGGGGFNSGPVYFNAAFNNTVAGEVCPGRSYKKAYVIFTPGQVLRVICGNSSQIDLNLVALDGTHWKLAWKQQNPPGPYTSPIITSSKAVQETTADTYCASKGSHGRPIFSFREPGPHFDVSCPK